MNERFVYSKQKGFDLQQTRPTLFVDGLMEIFSKNIKCILFIYLI